MKVAKICEIEPNRVEAAADRAYGTEPGPDTDEPGGASEPAEPEPEPEPEPGSKPGPEGISTPTEQLIRLTRWNMILLSGLLTVAILVCLYYGSAYFLPIAFAFFFNLLFKPITRKLKRTAKIPHPVGAMFVLIFFLAATAAGIYFLAEPVSNWMERAPQNLDDASTKLGKLLKEPMEKVATAAEKVEEMTEATGDTPSKPAVRVQETSVLDRIVTSTGTFLSGVFIVAGLLYFLLAAGDRMSRAMAMLLPRGDARRKAIVISNAIEHQVSVYLGLVTLINLCLGVAVALAMWAFGMPNPILWGVMAMLFNFVPYIGAVLGVVIVTVVAFASFDQPFLALAVGGVYYALSAIEGTFVTPTILGDRFRINPVFIFLWLLFCAWLWGAAGALLAVPLLTIVKIACEHIDRLEPVNEILSC